MRMVDIETGIEYIPYQKLPDGTLTISIRDDLSEIDKILMLNGVHGYWYEKCDSAKEKIMPELEKKIKELLLNGEGEKAKGFGEAMTIVANILMPKEAKHEASDLHENRQAAPAPAGGCS